MTYNEWRDELKDNLLSVSDEERKRVLDFYAEAYADKREAGKSEREIINDFGAPYDAAQRILNEKIDDEFKNGDEREEKNSQSFTPAPADIKQEKTDKKPKKENKKAKEKSGGGWLYVLFIIIFSIPLFIVIVCLAAISFTVTVAPFALIACGAAATGGSIGVMISGDITYGLYTLGSGLITLGAGIVLFPLLLKLVKLMWKLFKSFLSAVKRILGGKERAV